MGKTWFLGEKRRFGSPHGLFVARDLTNCQAEELGADCSSLAIDGCGRESEEGLEVKWGGRARQYGGCHEMRLLRWVGNDTPSLRQLRGQHGAVEQGRERNYGVGWGEVRLAA